MKLTQVRFLSVNRLIVLTISLLLSLALNGQVLAQSSQIQGARDNTQVFSGVVYGPIDQSDTLWRIASRYKQDARFSVYQVMLAIYELNPQAFENGNFNTMVNGATLRLPSDRYIARTDIQQARAKAEQDDRLFGRPNSVQVPSAPSTTSANSSADQNAKAENSLPANLKPEIPLVNQDDLSKTQSQLQTQLNALRRQQQQQFEALKNQVATSINSVETLLVENRKLNERLLQIDESNRNLTQTVETELQVQIDQQVEQLNQLINLVKDAEQRRIDEESKSILTLLSSNTAIILISSALTLIVLIAFGIFLLRRTGPAQQSTNDSKKSADIVDDELVIGELDDEIDQDSDDLLAALEQDTASQDDDILSDELEEDDVISSFSEDGLDSDFDLDDDISADDDFGDLDDMLVPDSPESKDAQQASTVISDELDFDALSMDDDALEEINLEEDFSPEQAESDTPVENDTSVESGISEEIDLTDDALDTVEEEFAPQATSDRVKPDTDDGSPEDIGLDENGDIDEDTLDQIEQRIEDKDRKINSLADELLDELDAGPTTEDNTPADPEQSEELTDAADDPIDVDTAEKAQTDEISGLADELEDDLEEEGQAQDELEKSLQNDDIIDLSDLDDEIDFSELGDDLDDPDDQVNVLANELLQELESEPELDSEPELADELNGLLNDLNEAPEHSSEDISSSAQETNIDSNVQEETSSLAQTPSKLDADDLLDDIPSFTKVSTDEEEDEHELEVESGAEQVVEEQSGSKLESEEEQDVLSSLPDLDDWLDEEELELETAPTFTAPSSAVKNETQEDKSASLEENIDSEFDLLALEIDDIDFESDFDIQGTNSAEDDLIKGLDDANFDEMLNELAGESDAESDIVSALNADSSQTSDDELTQAGLDLEALMTEDDKQGASQFDDELDSRDLEDAFIDVDELLKESDAMPQMQDRDLDLDLEHSLEQFVSNSDSELAQDIDVISDDENDQASNLDLAQVYIDMEDFEAAQELLDEVKRKGTEQQKSEADSLIARYTD